MDEHWSMGTRKIPQFSIYISIKTSSQTFGSYSEALFSCFVKISGSKNQSPEVDVDVDTSDANFDIPGIPVLQHYKSYQKVLLSLFQQEVSICSNSRSEPKAAKVESTKLLESEFLSNKISDRTDADDRRRRRRRPPTSKNETFEQKKTPSVGWGASVNKNISAVVGSCLDFWHFFLRIPPEVSTIKFYGTVITAVFKQASVTFCFKKQDLIL